MADMVILSHLYNIHHTNDFVAWRILPHIGILVKACTTDTLDVDYLTNIGLGMVRKEHDSVGVGFRPALGQHKFLILTIDPDWTLSTFMERYSCEVDTLNNEPCPYLSSDYMVTYR